MPNDAASPPVRRLYVTELASVAIAVYTAWPTPVFSPIAGAVVPDVKFGGVVSDTGGPPPPPPDDPPPPPPAAAARPSPPAPSPSHSNGELPPLDAAAAPAALLAVPLVSATAAAASRPVSAPHTTCLPAGEPGS